jgi:D-alanyl-D-alanine carboxypeptidase
MKSIHIEVCHLNDLHEVRQWLSRQENRAMPTARASLNQMLQDECLLLARSGSRKTHSSDLRLQGVAGLDLKTGSIQLLVLNQAAALQPLITSLERSAVSFGMLSLDLRIKPGTKRALTLPNYKAHPDSPELLRRNLRRRLTTQARKARQLNQQLGVPADYGRRHRLRLQQEPRELASIGKDVFGREQFMLPKAARALLELIRGAASEGMVIKPVSAFRSMDYQAVLLQNKLDKGQSMAEILCVSAAPGYSEHHSGRAVDLTTDGPKPLEEEFAETEAFAWLSRRAGDFGFRLSYPRGNRHGVTYEPWHWYFSG